MYLNHVDALYNELSGTMVSHIVALRIVSVVYILSFAYHN